MNLKRVLTTTFRSKIRRKNQTVHGFLFLNLPKITRVPFICKCGHKHRWSDGYSHNRRLSDCSFLFTLPFYSLFTGLKRRLSDNAFLFFFIHYRSTPKIHIQFASTLPFCYLCFMDPFCSLHCPHSIGNLTLYFHFHLKDHPTGRDYTRSHTATAELVKISWLIHSQEDTARIGDWDRLLALVRWSGFSLEPELC